MIKTKENAFAYENTGNACVDFFSKAGSLYETSKKKDFYKGNSSAKELFINAFKEEAVTALKLLFWLRDCRGGAGNRSGARSIIKYLANHETELMKANISLIPVYGRWDDLRALFGTPLQNLAAEFWVTSINGGSILAAKWAKRSDKPLRNAINMKESEFRKFLANIRKNHIVEHKMCQGEWEDIQFKTVPSVAMSRYTKCFDKHAHDNFQKYKESIKKGETTVHADTLFPHDCVRTALNGDKEMAELQFNALPNYFEDTNEKIMVICDTSGSMNSTIGGSVRAVDVSMGLALYCSSRMNTDSPFYKRFISFCSESKFTDWRDKTFISALWDRNVFNGAVGSTRIDLALNLILKTAIDRSISQNLMPTTLLIVSDMQFSEGACNSYGFDARGLSEKESLTEIETMMRKFEDAGYERPKIVYWNTAGYKGQQDTVISENVGMVSGFSPSVLKAIFGGDDFSPYGIMLKAIEKYKVMVPMEGKMVEM